MKKIIKERNLILYLFTILFFFVCPSKKKLTLLDIGFSRKLTPLEGVILSTRSKFSLRKTTCSDE